MRSVGILGGVVAAWGALPPGPGPFTQSTLLQPVTGANRALKDDGWKDGRLCDVSKSPYLAKNGTNATAALRQAIEDCGDLAAGGTVLVPSGLTLTTASLWLKSNLTLRVEEGAALLGSTLVGDAPLTYARRNALMLVAHAGFINGGQCLEFDPLSVQGTLEDCKLWSKLENVVIEGGGLLDANADFWYDVTHPVVDDLNTRPMMLDLMWVDGLTIRDMKIRRPGFWTVHPTFSNNVRVTGNDIFTYGHNTDGCDPDSSWNVYIADNKFSTGDDCIAIKAGRDWSGLMVNISTQNVLAERNHFAKGHGVSIGSESSGWIRNVTIRDSICNGTNKAVRLKTMRGRGGGIANILYQNITGSVIEAVEISLNYHIAPPTNNTATPAIHDIMVRDVHVTATGPTGKQGDFVHDLGATHTYYSIQCKGLEDSLIDNIAFENVTVENPFGLESVCEYCNIQVDPASSSIPDACSPSTISFV